MAWGFFSGEPQTRRQRNKCKMSTTAYWFYSLAPQFLESGRALNHDAETLAFCVFVGHTNLEIYFWNGCFLQDDKNSDYYWALKAVTHNQVTSIKIIIFVHMRVLINKAHWWATIVEKAIDEQGLKKQQSQVLIWLTRSSMPQLQYKMQLTDGWRTW